MLTRPMHTGDFMVNLVFYAARFLALSLVLAIGIAPVIASAQPDPLLEPPASREGSRGFAVGP